MQAIARIVVRTGNFLGVLFGRGSGLLYNIFAC